MTNNATSMQQNHQKVLILLHFAVLETLSHFGSVTFKALFIPNSASLSAEIFPVFTGLFAITRLIAETALVLAKISKSTSLTYTGH